jgi:hypothetical protein
LIKLSRIQAALYLLGSSAVMFYVGWMVVDILMAPLDGPVLLKKGVQILGLSSAAIFIWIETLRIMSDTPSK